jgi:hypothetical protein
MSAWVKLTGAALAHFETFKKSLIPLRQDPRVTVQRRGTITINAAAYVALGSPEAVELLFDRQAMVLGLRGVEPSVPHAAFVRPSARTGNGPFVISAMAFLKFYGIDTSVARRWPARLDRGVLCVDLRGTHDAVSKAPPTSGSRRSGRRPRPRPSGSTLGTDTG